MNTKILEDISQMTTQRKRSKSRCGILAVFREALLTIKPDVQDSIPTKLDYLTLTIFSRFLNTFRGKLKRGRKEQGTGEYKDVEVRLSASMLEGACSVLSYLYNDSGKNKEATSPQLCPKLSSYKKGSRRIAASKKNYLR